MSKTQVFYRCVKAKSGHPQAGLYGVEKVYIKDGTIYKKEMVHEWDLRLISEAILAKLGGSAAFDAYAEDIPLVDAVETPAVVPVKARTKDEVQSLPAKQLKKEQRGL